MAPPRDVVRPSLPGARPALRAWTSRTRLHARTLSPRSSAVSLRHAADSVPGRPDRGGRQALGAARAPLADRPARDAVRRADAAGPARPARVSGASPRQGNLGRARVRARPRDGGRTRRCLRGPRGREDLPRRRARLAGRSPASSITSWRRSRTSTRCPRRRRRGPHAPRTGDLRPSSCRSAWTATRARATRSWNCTRRRGDGTSCDDTSPTSRTRSSATRPTARAGTTACSPSLFGVRRLMLACIGLEFRHPASGDLICVFAPPGRGIRSPWPRDSAGDFPAGSPAASVSPASASPSP